MATTLKPGTGERLGQWWQLRSRSEKRWLAVAGALALAALAWYALWQPLLEDSERTAQRIIAQRAALTQARRQADDIATLSRSAAVPAVRDVRADLDAVLNRQATKPSALERLADDRVRLTFDSIGFDAMVLLVELLQREAKLRVAELTSTARVEPGQVRAEVTLAP